jgi:RNA polymerase sigma-70 factor, ECF subfamily
MALAWERTAPVIRGAILSAVVGHERVTSESSPADVTRLLLAWKGGDEEALQQLMPLVYGELKRIAAYHLSRERPGGTLQATALIHEAYIRLVRSKQPEWEGRVHFFGLASRQMRNILVDAARRHRAQKRRVEDAGTTLLHRDEDLLRLDDALNELARLDERKCQAIEMKYFGGLSRDEIAAALSTSPATVGRDLRMAEAWLRREMGVTDDDTGTMATG